MASFEFLIQLFDYVYCHSQEVRRRAEGGVRAREDQSEDRQEAAGEEVVRPGPQREWQSNDTPSMVFMRRRQQRLRTTNVHNNPVRAFIMLLAQEVSKSHKPLLTVPQKRCPLSNILGVFIHPCISSCERLSQSDGRSSRISLRKLKHFECRLRDVL